MEDQKSRRGAIGLVAVIATLVVIVALVNNSGSAPQAAPSSPVTVATSPITVPPVKPVAYVAPPVQAPVHNYSMEDEGEYGYEGTISENDKNAGRAVAPMVMFRYLGVKDGSYTIQAKDGSMAQTMSCKVPCEFIKIRTYYAGTIVKTETVRSSGGSIMEAALVDAYNGQLKQYRPAR